MPGRPARWFPRTTPARNCVARLRGDAWTDAWHRAALPETRPSRHRKPTSPCVLISKRTGPRLPSRYVAGSPRASLVGVARGYDALLSWDTRPRDTPRIAAVSDTDNPAALRSAASARYE